MSEEKKPSFTLNSVDDMFTTQEMRDEAAKKKIEDIPVKLIESFPHHPYKVKDDLDMQNLMESIRENGVMTPCIVRPIDRGKKYQMISGHRRMFACRKLGIDTIPCDVREIEKYDATIMMVDSNMYRSEILPSEKAFAYKMRLEAMRRQVGRPPKNSVPVAQDFKGKTSRELLGEQVGESQDNVRRYIRLTELTPLLLDMVDNREISMRPAVEISYFPKELQDALADCMAMEACTPSHDQTIRMRRLLAENKLTAESITAIMQEEKPNQKEKIVIRLDRAEKLIPKDVPVYKRNEYVLEALEYYSKHRQQGRAQQEAHSERAKHPRSQDDWER